MNITNEERDTILAALRWYQRELGGSWSRSFSEIHDEIATNGGAHGGLTQDDIDELCERINVDYPERPRIAIIVEGGLVQGIVTDAEHLIGADALVIDYDTDGAEEGSTCAIPQGKGKTEDAYVSTQEIGRPAKGVLEAAVAFVEADEEAEAE